MCAYIERRHFNDLERTLTEISRSRRYFTLNISETVKDTKHFYNEILIVTRDFLLLCNVYHPRSDSVASELVVFLVLYVRLCLCQHDDF